MGRTIPEAKVKAVLFEQLLCELACLMYVVHGLEGDVRSGEVNVTRKGANGERENVPARHFSKRQLPGNGN